MPIQTLAELFLVASGYDKPELLMHQVGGKYTSISTKQFVGDVHRLAKALRALGVQRGDRVALMAENGPDWPLVDFASLCVGAALNLGSADQKGRRRASARREGRARRPVRRDRVDGGSRH